jgi:Ca2+-transporting ATPase
MQKDIFYNISAEETAIRLDTDISNGLASAEAKSRLSKFGRNELIQKQRISALAIFLGQFRDFIIWVLIAAALVSGLLREWIDALAIIAVVVLNAFLGFMQEYRAEKSLAALKKLSSPSSKVIREGRHEVIASSLLVPGDLIELEAGDNVPADCRLIWTTSSFTVLEASLTGESTPVMKTVAALEEKEVPLADRANMAYMGTTVSSGKAKAVITDTGMDTELGTIAGMVQETRKETTPLQRKLEEFGKWIVYLCFALVTLVFILEWIRGGRLVDVFLTAVSLAVAAIPEGLPAVVTIALALGVHRMVKRNALIRKLPSVETLGCATVICSDKTGTLTKNEMTVQKVLAGNRLFDVSGIGYGPDGRFALDSVNIDAVRESGLIDLLRCAVLCNNAQLIKQDRGYRIFGDPTEAALLTAAAKAGMIKEEFEKEYIFADEIPFDSERKIMTIIRKRGGDRIAFVKGAPDVLLDRCSNIPDRGLIEKTNDRLASEAMRVLAFGYRVLPDNVDAGNADAVEKELTFLGLMAMIDPPRDEVRDAMHKCATAGIKAVMITGDHKNTAVAIARQLGLFGRDSIALSGIELDGLSDEELFNKVGKISVYARVSPEHKLRVVKAWRRHSQVVAMTGDGVNDAPAVKEADIGVAMGMTGTDVTKEVSDMVVTDDNFASIVSAVEEGRGIYENIRKFVHYMLSCNTGEILVMLASSLIGLPVPLLPIQILWVNLVTDSLPALALGVEPVEPGVMKKPPRDPKEPVVTVKRAVLMLVQGSFIAFCSLLAFMLVLFVENGGIAKARTAAFFVLSCSQLFHAFNCRSMTKSLFKMGVFSNRSLVLAVFVAFMLQMAVIYAPACHGIFKTVPLEPYDWLIVIAVSSLPLWLMEAWKNINKGLPRA